MSYAHEKYERNRRRSLTSAIHHYIGQSLLFLLGVPVTAVAINSFWWPMTTTGSSIVLLMVGGFMVLGVILLFFGLIEVD